jgi:hypothetical protein
MNKQIQINDIKKKDIQELARIFASKAPKETTYNNVKTRKYFNAPTLKEDERPTVKDDLIYDNKIQTGIFEVYQGALGSSQEHNKNTHHRAPSKVLIVDKRIVSWFFI